jgi:hypothetical protein
MIPSFNSPEEYSHFLIKTILEGEKTIPEDQQMPINLLTYLTENIEEYVETKWNEYLTGKQETFMLGEGEMEMLFNKAGELYTQDVINDMVDKNMLETYIGEDGDILYGLSETGKLIAKNLKDDETN